MSRPTLDQLRALVLDEIDSEWTTPTELTHTFRVDYGIPLSNSTDWPRIALILERLANDGVLELKRPGSGIRRFRRRRPT